MVIDCFAWDLTSGRSRAFISCLTSASQESRNVQIKTSLRDRCDVAVPPMHTLTSAPLNVSYPYDSFVGNMFVIYQHSRIISPLITTALLGCCPLGHRKAFNCSHHRDADWLQQLFPFLGPGTGGMTKQNQLTPNCP